MIPTEAPVSGGDNFFSEIGAALTAGLDTGSETTEQQDATPQSDSSTEIPAGEEPTTPETGTPEPATPAGEAPTSEYKLTEDGSAYLVPKDQFPTLNGYKQYATEVQGIFPTVNDAKAANTESADLRSMYADYVNGSNEDFQKFVEHFAGANADESQKGQFQQAFVRLSQAIPDALKKVNPDGYTKLSERFTGESINNAYKVAQDAAAYAEQSGMAGDKEYADLMLKQAQYLEWGLTGKFRAELEKVDPVKAEQERLAAERQEFEGRVAASMKRDFDSYNKTTVDGPKWNQYWGEIDKTLAPIKDKYDGEIFEAVKEQISKKILSTLSSDYDWARTHENERKSIQAGYEGLWKQQQRADSLQPRVQAYHTDFIARVRRILPSIAAPLINKATANAVANKTTAPRTQKTPQTPRTAAPATSPAAPVHNPGTYNIHEDPSWAKLFELK